MVCRQYVNGFDISDYVCQPLRGVQTFVMYTTQLMSIMLNAADVGKPRIVVLGVSATCHYVLICHACLHLHLLLIDGCHTTSVFSVPYKIIFIPFYVVSLDDNWHRPNAVPSGLTWVGYRCQNTHSGIMLQPDPVSILTCVDPMHWLSASIYNIV